MRTTLPVIADSSALVSLASVTDQNHSKAVLYSQSFVKTNRPLIIPSEVIAETINTIGRKISHQMAMAVGNELLGSSAYFIVDSNTDLRIIAFDKFKKQKGPPELSLKPAKASFTDCVVMAVADYYETKDIFGFDKIFSKNGFKIIT